MTRSTLGSANRTESAKPAVRLCEFAEFQFPGGTIRVTTADRDITWGGNAYTMSAVLVGVGEIGESSDLKARRVSIRLSSVDATLLARIMGDNFHYAKAQVWLGFLDEDWELVADPYTLTDELLMSNVSLTIAKDSGGVELSCETWDLFNQRDSAALATPESQKLRYPGDTGQDRVSDIESTEVIWGGTFQRA